jgi:uncharacterized repeat protein (TIGR02543 family)
MAITYVGTKTATITSYTAVQTKITGFTIAAGNMMVLTTKSSSSQYVTSVLDTLGQSWFNPVYTGSSGPHIEIWYVYCRNGFSATDAIAVTLGGGSNQLTTVCVSEVAGANANYGSAIDVTYNGFATGSVSNTTHALTSSTTQKDIIFSAVGTSGASGQTFTANTAGFTKVTTQIVPGTGAIQMGTSYSIQAATGTGSNQWTWTTSAGWAMAMCAFFPASIVTFSANGGTGSLASQSASGLTALTLNNNAITRSDYIFNGWKDSSLTAYADGASYDFNVSMTMSAQWIQYTVTFDGNTNTGGSTASETHGATTALTANGFTKTGYAFNGWNTAANGSGTAYANTANYAFTASLTLYAQWIQYQLTVYPNFGALTGGSGSPYTGMVWGGQGALQPESSFGWTSPTNYSFGGWNTAANGSGTAYIDQDPNYVFNSSTPTTPLYAQWTINTYSVTFNSNFPAATYTSGPMSNQNITYNQTAALTINSLVCSGYRFTGWNTAADGSGTAYANQANYTMTSTTGATLYAQWAHKGSAGLMGVGS